MNERDVQRLMTNAGYYRGDIDGDFGPRSRTAIEAILNNRQSELTSGWKQWSLRRKGIAAGQLVLKYAGHEVNAIDGFVGPQTRFALAEFDIIQSGGVIDNWRDNDEDIPETPLLSTVWPREIELTRFFGEAGGPQCSAGKVNLPFTMKIAWNKSQKITRFSCHEKVVDSADRIYRRIASAYSPSDISRLGFDLFGGCFNFRKKRGGSSLSVHSWGVAIDHDPNRNQLRWGRDRATLAIKECEEFHRCWEAEGWLNLGRVRNYDWMHVQAVRF